MVITAFIVFSAGLLIKAITEKNVSERNQLTAEAFYMAEGANENAINAFLSGIADFQIANTIAVYNCPTTFTMFGNTVVNSTVTRLEASDRLVAEGSINVYVCNYEVASTVTHPGNNAIVVSVHQIIARRLIPTFQHAVFYNDDLEILPGAAMTLSGRIHSNQDIYVHSRNTLTIDSNYFRSAGDIINKRKDDPGDPMGGTVSIRVTQGGAPTYANMNGLDSNNASWVTESINRWQGTVQSAAHGVTKLTTPSVGSIQPTGYYANQANVVITNNTIVKGGVALTEGVDYPAGTVTSSTASFYNNREGKYIRMTQIDLDKLAGKTGTCGAGACSNNLPSNGLLYTTRTDAGANEPGIELVNGSEIVRNGGLTVVTNQPMYIKGNYNTVNEKPTSIIADSVNLLSNNWNNSNSDDGLGSRTATQTTFNVACVSGIDQSTVGHYNGGLENYPRLHENWSGVNLNIKGSFVELWNSSVATGAWVYGGSQYTAPNRSWTYNTSFNNLANLPPFTPMAVEAQRIAWWQD